MKVCFVGIGSIAKRHIRNLHIICKEKGIDLHIDALRRSSSSHKDDQPDLSYNVYYSTEELPSNYDIIFLTNPTEYHADMLQQLHHKSKHFFIEKPVASLTTVDNLKNIHFRESSVYYVACPLRYNNVIQYIKANIDVSTVNSVRSISSSYLPDWRPHTDYRNTYSAHNDLGGGVSIDLIHEWDYLSYIFGMPRDVKFFKGKVSNLEIDSDDFAIYIATYDSMTVELHLDYYGRQSIRKMELYTDDDTIIADLICGTISYLKKGIVIDLPEERDSYQMKELNHFLNLVLSNQPSSNNITNAVQVLKLTQGII
ncbi:MAG: Gfo/Idh/MocA family oxidoreductase [Lachnospiraceae bacterium]|nr:Gfo/Idh/MocA family oxidoreductase [Lachnospiraceae bacterium]